MKVNRIIAILTILAILFAAVSCAPSDDGRAGGTKETKPYTGDAENIKLVREKWSDYDFDGYSFRILSIDKGSHIYYLLDDRGGYANEIYYEEESSDNYESAVYRRNQMVEELLNIKIQPIWGGKTLEIPGTTQKLINMQNDDFDMSLMTMDQAMKLGMEGYFYNLHDMNTFDIYANWWDQKLVDAYSYANHKLYIICGDYTLGDEYSVPVIFYNKNVITELNLTDPVELVDSGDWTIDEMMRMAEIATMDTGNMVMGDEDRWGYVDNYKTAMALLEGCDQKIAVADENGIPQVMCTGEEFLTAAEYIYNRVINSGAIWQGENDTAVAMISEDRALFYYDMLGRIHDFREMDGVFSLLPLPKLNEQQEKYTCISDAVWSSALSVPITAVANLDKIGVIMNVLGGLSTDTVHKTLHEVILGAKLVRLPETVRMLDMALDSMEYDWGEFKWATPLTSAITKMVPGAPFTLASDLRINLRSVQKQLLIFTKDIED